MSEELRELYQEQILDHSKRPRNKREIGGARSAEGYNPLCGDRATVYVALDGDVVKDVSFVGQGCSISTASASMMTEAIKGKSIEEVLGAFDRFQGMITTPIDTAVDLEGFGKLEALAGVREFPMRVKCATLAWHTLKAALTKSASVARTE